MKLESKINTHYMYIYIWTVSLFCPPLLMQEETFIDMQFYIKGKVRHL